MIFFVDFDGVLHPNSDDSEHFSCAPLLWELLRRHPDVRVVLSTGWRFERPLDELRRLACQNGGEDVAERVIDATPLLRHGAAEQSRERDCLAWLDAHKCDGEPWLALDDMPILFEPGSPHLYPVNAKCGLMHHDVERISALIRRVAG